MYTLMVEIKTSEYTGLNASYVDEYSWFTLNTVYSRIDSAEYYLNLLLEQECIVSGKIIKNYHIVMEK